MGPVFEPNGSQSDPAGTGARSQALYTPGWVTIGDTGLSITLPRRIGNFTCQCCGEISYSGDTYPVCSDCRATGCESRPGRIDGDVAYYECQRPYEGE